MTQTIELAAAAAAGFFVADLAARGIAFGVRRAWQRRRRTLVYIEHCEAQLEIKPRWFDSIKQRALRIRAVMAELAAQQEQNAIRARKSVQFDRPFEV